MKTNDVKKVLDELDGLTPPARDEMLSRCGITPRTPEETAPSAAAEPRKRFPKLLAVGLISAAAASLLAIGTAAAVNENREYRDALDYCERYGISTEGMSRAEIKEARRRFTVSGGGTPEGEAKEAVIRGNELLLCTEEEALAAVNGHEAGFSVPDALKKETPVYTELFSDENGNAYCDHKCYPEETSFIGRAKEGSAGGYDWRTEVSPLNHVQVYGYGDRVIVTGYRGRLSEDPRASVLCLSGETGKILWRKDIRPDGACSVLPMMTVTDEEGFTVFCRTSYGGERLSRQYRIVTLRFDENGMLLTSKESDLMDLFLVKDAKKLSSGYCLCLENLKEAEERERYPYEFVYLGGTFEIKNRYRLTVGAALAAYEPESGAESGLPAGNFNAVSDGSFLSIAQIEECGDVIWLCGCTGALPGPKAYQPSDDGKGYRQLTGLSDPVIAGMRKTCAAYLLAWDPIAGEVRYFCTAPGCMTPSGFPLILPGENGEITWRVGSVVGFQAVSPYISSMRGFITYALYDNVFRTDGTVSSRFLGGATLPY